MAERSSVMLEGESPFLGCHGVRAHDYCFCPVVTAPLPSAGEKGDMLAQFVRGDATRQSRSVLELASTALGKLGTSLARGVKIDQFVTHPEAAAPYLGVRAQFMETSNRPSSTHIQVSGLMRPEALVGIQLIAHAGGGDKEPVVVPGMPASPGKPFKPAPHALVQGDFIFVTGQVPYDFDEGYPDATRIDDATWYQSKATSETRYTLAKVERIMKHLGGSLADCLKLEIYLNDLTEIVDAERVLTDAFGDDMPARSYIPTVRLAPTQARVEITAICRNPATKAPISRVKGGDDGWLAPAAVEYGGFVFTSTLAGNIAGRLDARLTLDDQMALMAERVAGLAPLRDAGLDAIAFAAMQIVDGTDLNALRWAFQTAVPGHRAMAISPVLVQAPLAWTQGAFQADFICAV